MAGGNGQQTKPGTAVAITRPPSLLEKFSKPLGLSPDYFKQVVKATVLKTKDRPATDEELAMFLAIADRYGLDVWTKQIHGFVDKGAIVPIVGVDGWNYLETMHPDFAGEEIVMPPREEWEQIDAAARICPPWMECRIFHKSHPERPTVHREYLDECYVPPRKTSNGAFNGPWQTHTKRMMQHKTRVQTIRKAFGYGGIYDADEAQRIMDGEVIDGSATEVQTLGEEGWTNLLRSAADFGFTEDDVLANAAALLYEGPGPEMPREVAVQLFRAMKQAAEENAAAAEEAARRAGEAADEEDGPLGDPEEPQLPRKTLHDAQRERVAPRTPSQMAADLAAQATAKEEAKPIARRDVNRVYTQATIHEVEEPELLEWLQAELGVASVEEIPQRRLGEVLAYLESRRAEQGAA